MTVETRKRRMSQAQKTDRAFWAYIDLLDAAEAMRARVSGQLAVYDLTMNGFRVLELLEREGPTRTTVVAERCRRTRPNLDVIVKRLSEQGWVESEMAPAPGESGESDGAKSARRFLVLKLTDEGQEFIRSFLPRHGKVVKAFMRALNGREQQKLSHLCRKIIEGDVIRFLSEMEHEGT